MKTNQFIFSYIFYKQLDFSVICILSGYILKEIINYVETSNIILESIVAKDKGFKPSKWRNV